MTDMRAILRNLRQWPTAAEPQGGFQTYVREQVRGCVGMGAVELEYRKGDLGRVPVVDMWLVRFLHIHIKQFARGKGETDKERVKALRQQAKDFAILLKNLDRQKVR